MKVDAARVIAHSYKFGKVLPPLLLSSNDYPFDELVLHISIATYGIPQASRDTFLDHCIYFHFLFHDDD